MLIRFRVQNFLSFNEEIEFSMVAGKVQQHPEQVARQTGRPTVELLRAALIYGANASGKSNLVKAIDFARKMVVEGVRAKDAIPRKPFKLNAARSAEPSRFEFEIQQNGKLYAYGFALDSKRIHEEWLHEIRPASEKILFHRTTSADEINTIVFDVKATKKERDLLDLVSMGTPPNRLFLRESTERNIKHFADIYEWFEKVLVIIYPTSFHTLAPIGAGSPGKFGDSLIDYLQRFSTGICGYDMQPVSEPLSELPKDLLGNIENSLEDGLVSSIVNPNGQRYFAKREAEQVKIYKLLLRHRDETCGSDILFEMDEESDGTLRLLDLIPMLYPGEGRNRVVIIDELDRSLHPSLSYEFIATFLRAENQKQLIVTTHEANLLDLDLVRRDEVWFIEKDSHGSSSVYSLEEFSPRYDKDIRKGYMLGRFGAIPFITHPNSMFGE
ncbi:MAG TPA: ATP-binding protein [Anaerolineaceae bacterium]|nr:ATP-binding protein [Anaerolineaceae bacterium]HPN52251.1 ATP-binding protein [Anaerolineaceae bacterium]